jgi:hypothetical protein
LSSRKTDCPQRLWSAWRTFFATPAAFDGRRTSTAIDPAQYQRTVDFIQAF